MVLRYGILRVVCLFVCIGLAMIISAGCESGPVFKPPGTIYEQRSRAVLADPFPNNELGTPVVGGRPRGFETPLAQPVNVQASPYSDLNKNNRGILQRLFGWL